MRGALYTFGRDKRASISVMTAFFSVVALGFAALGVDYGKVTLDRRKAQSIADLAALAAAADLPRAERAAAATAARNAFQSDSALALELGIYRADATVPPDQRFVRAAGGANAARVTIETRSELTFARMVLSQSHVAIRTTATAASASFAGFAIGSRLVGLQDGLANAMLGSLIGANLSLSAMDYRALADARISLFEYLPALATRARLTSLTYEQLLASQVRIADMVEVMSAMTQDTDGAPTGASRALGRIVQALSGNNGSVRLGSLFNLGPYAQLQVGQKPTTAISLSTMDLIGATLQLANGQRQVSLDLGVGLPGIASATIKLGVGERPVGTSWLTIGAPGAQVHTAQTRLLLIVTLVGASPITTVRVPLYIELASATARLTAANCSLTDPLQSSVTLAVTPAVVDAWIGDVSATDFQNMRTPANPARASLVALPLVSVFGRARATITNMAPESVTFSMSEIQRQSVKTVGTRNFTQSLLTRLTRDLSLEVDIAGLGLGLGSDATRQLVGGIVGGATPTIDRLLASVLQTLGIGIGQADVWVSGLRCDGAVLVN